MITHKQINNVYHETVLFNVWEEEKSDLINLFASGKESYSLSSCVWGQGGKNNYYFPKI